MGTCACYWTNRQGTTGRINKEHETKGGIHILYMVHVGLNSRESAIRMRATVLVLYVKDVIGERVRGR